MTSQISAAPISFDNTQAFKEGWGVFEVGPQTDTSFIAKYGRWSLDRLGEGNTCGPVRFGEDADQAWGHVVAQALAGSVYHQSAIQFLRQHTPLEIGFMRDLVPTVDQIA